MTEHPSTTEDVPPVPGWVEDGLDEILAALPQGTGDPHALRALRDGYLDCLAAARGPVDIDAVHDRCRLALLTALRTREHVAEPVLAELEQRLEALEAAITAQVR